MSCYLIRPEFFRPFIRYCSSSIINLTANIKKKNRITSDAPHTDAEKCFWLSFVFIVCHASKKDITSSFFRKKNVWGGAAPSVCRPHEDQTLTPLISAFKVKWFIKECAVNQLMNTRNGIIVIHYIKCYITTVGKTLVMYQTRYEKPPKNHSLFVAKKGGNVFPI